MTGALGQIGTELVPALRQRYGWDNVIAADLRAVTDHGYQQLDVLDAAALAQVIAGRQVTQVYHLAAILSANGEANPLQTWELNMQSLLNVLEAARKYQLRVFWPSSIAVFGRNSDKAFCCQHQPQQPTTVYGISKAAGELWCQYYFERYGVDVRSLRYPGLVSHSAAPGGGTTDYAVAIFQGAVQDKAYQCFLKANTLLPMLYMADAVRATLELMDAPAETLTVRTAYNLWGLTFSPKELADQIRVYLPDFELTCVPDARQAIADAWPDSINGHQSHRDWGWKHQWYLPDIVADMLWHTGDAALKQQIEQLRETV